MTTFLGVAVLPAGGSGRAHADQTFAVASAWSRTVPVGQHLVEVAFTPPDLLQVRVTDAMGAPLPAAQLALAVRVQGRDGRVRLVRLEPGPDGTYVQARVRTSAAGSRAEIWGSVAGQPLTAPVGELPFVPEPAPAPAGGPHGADGAGAPTDEPQVAPAEAPGTELGPHGGRIVQSGDRLVEVLVQPDGDLRVWVTSLDGTPVPPELVGRRLRLRVGGRTHVVVLSPDPDGIALHGRWTGPAGSHPAVLELEVAGAPLVVSYPVLVLHAAVAVRPRGVVGAHPVVVEPHPVVVGPHPVVVGPHPVVVGPHEVVVGPHPAVIVEPAPVVVHVRGRKYRYARYRIDKHGRVKVKWKKLK